MSAVSPLLLQDPDKLQEEKQKFVYNDHVAVGKLLRGGGSEVLGYISAMAGSESGIHPGQVISPPHIHSHTHT